jgi:hypothetical protein
MEKYDEMLADWHRVDFELANHAASGNAKRRMTECVRTNFDRSSNGN